MKESTEFSEAVYWDGQTDFVKKGQEVGVFATQDEDIRNLRELITYGLKGILAYVYHAKQYGRDLSNIEEFLQQALVQTRDDHLSMEDLVALVLKTGDYSVQAMAALDQANTSAYGSPEISSIEIGVGWGISRGFSFPDTIYMI